MDSNPINEGALSGRIEATDDVEGHGIRISGIDGPDTDDVEGHMPRIGRTLVEDQADDEDDDTEGHGVRVRF